MKILLLIASTIALSLSIRAGDLPQRYFSGVEQVMEAIEEKIKEVMPEWNATKITPPSHDTSDYTSDKVALRQWHLNKKNVKVAILQHQSEVEAERVLRQFAADKRTNDKLRGLGDEAFSWGLRGSVAFRRGNLTVYVSTVVIEELNPEEARINPVATREQASRREREGEARLSRAFAQRVDAALR